MKRVTIYGLEDPRNGIIRYVGLTEDVYLRFLAHIRVEKLTEPKDAWVQELRDLNLMVIMRTLEVVDTMEIARVREAYWIHHYQYLAMKVNLSFFNKYLPVNSIVHLRPNVVVTISEDQINTQLAAIPNWEEKLGKLSNMIGEDQSVIFASVWECKPGRGERYKVAKGEYKVLVSALRSKLQNAS